MMSPGASAQGLMQQQQAQQSRMNPAYPQSNMYYSQQQQTAQRWPSTPDPGPYGSTQAQTPAAYPTQTPQQHANSGFPSGTTGFQPGPPGQTQQQVFFFKFY